MMEQGSGPSTQAVEFSQECDTEPEAEFPDGCWGKLVSLSPEQHGDVFLRGEEQSLGRHASCSVVFSSQHLSGVHCKITRVKDVTMVTDLSTNGTYLNGTLIGKGTMKLMSNLDELSLLMPNNKSVLSIRYVYKEPEPTQGPLEEYQIRQMLGAGSYAKVHLGVHKTTGQQVAVKIIDKKKMVGGSSRADAVRDEVSTLQRVSHPNIIRIYNHFEDDTNVYLVLELVVGGELFDFVVKYADGLPESAALAIFRQISEAVAYLHSNGISHRDLKPENILLAEAPTSDAGPFVVKLSDFGLSRLVNDGSQMSTMCGTPTYLAPEVLSKKQYDHKVDIWAMGVILYILLSGKPPFDDLQHISFGKYDFSDSAWKKVSPEAQDLIKRMLVVESSQRLNAQQVLAHAWLQGTKLEPDQFLAPAPVTKKAKSDPEAPKEPCRYGKACYRKNPQHLAQFSHDF